MDLERMACPECGAMNPMLGVVNEIRQYKCRACGQVYYTPDSCLRDSVKAESEAEPRPEIEASEGAHPSAPGETKEGDTPSDSTTSDPATPRED